MINQKTIRSIIFEILIVSFILITGCTKSNVIMYAASDKLHVPATFDIKIIGDTVYTYDEGNIPVGNMLKQDIEANINKIEKFSVNKQSNHRYAIIIGINYDPQFQKKYPQTGIKTMISCGVSVYSEKINDSGEKILGEKVLFFPYQGNDAIGLLSIFGLIDINDIKMILKPWRTVIENCAKKITDTLNDTFPNN